MRFTSILKKSAEITNSQGCAACGVCCELFGHSVVVSDGDVMRWQKEGRDDILRLIGPDRHFTEAAPKPCPFLERVDLNTGRCSIQETKPAMCRAYPTQAHGGRCAAGKTP